MNVNIRVMNIETTKLELMQLLLQTRKKSILSRIRKIYEEENIASERISIEQYNKEIDESLAQIERGETHTHEEVKSMIRQWGRK